MFVRRCLLPSRAAQWPTRICTRQLAILVLDLAVDEHVFHSTGKPCWKGICRFVVDGLGAENRDVSVKAGKQKSTIEQMLTLRRHR
jgi:hypothetical protein